MSSDLAIRREARRQRILNNAETRLRRIVDGEKGPTEERITNGPYHHNVQQNDVSPEQQSHSACLVDRINPEVRTIYVNPQPSRANSVNELYELETKEKTRRCIIIIMALLMRCLMLILEEYFTYFFKTSFANVHLNKVFLPLLAFEIIECQFFEPPLVRFGSFSTLLLMKLSPQRTQHVMVTLSTIIRLSQDVIVYFVTFISFDFVISIIER